MTKRRGPKPKPGVREKNGRLSRKSRDIAQRRKDAFDMEARENMSVAVEARMRLHGLSERAARDPKAGSVVGRMLASGAITQAQYEAAMLYLASIESYHVAQGSPAQARAIDLNRVHGIAPVDEAEWTAWAEKTKRRHESMMEAIQEAQNQIRGRGALHGALDALVTRDVYVTYLEGDLRIALNAIARWKGIERILAA